MTKVKICGLTRECETEYMNRWHPDFCGFIFAGNSRRYVSRERAAVLKALLSPEIRTVGVFVNARPEAAAACAGEGIIDLIQLHGQEDEGYLKALRDLTDCPVIQAFSGKEAEDIRRAEESSADYILLDHGAGGTGKCFNWKLLSGLKRPYFLAGGLTPANVERAVRLYRPYAVDISSGVETDGVKDPIKIETCIRRIKDV